MIEMLREFVPRFQQLKGYLGWFVSADGLALCTGDLLSKDFTQQFGEFSSLVFVEPGTLFFAEADGTFDLDRVPDFFAVPATELGAAVLEMARVVSGLEAKGDDLQDTYMEILDQWWRVDRYLRGAETRAMFHAKVQEAAAAFDAHRAEEREARHSLVTLLVQFKSGDTTAPVKQPDLSLPEEDDGEHYSEEGEGRTIH